MTAGTVRDDDRGFLYGDGVFDTMLALDGRVAFLDRHLDRLARGAHALGIALDRASAREACLRAAAEAGGPRAVRVTLTRGPGAGLAPRGAGPPTLVARSGPVPWSDRDRAEGVAVAWARRRRVPPECLEPDLKTLNYLPNVLARRDAEAEGCREALFLALDGAVVEAAAANVFVVAGGRVATPPLSSGCFPGFTRADVLRLLAADGVPCAERALAPADVDGADEVFLTSSLAGAVPVVRVGGRAVGGGRPGPVAARAHTLWWTALLESLQTWTTSRSP